MTRPTCETCREPGVRFGYGPTDYRHLFTPGWSQVPAHPFIPAGTVPIVAAAMIRHREVEDEMHRAHVAQVRAEARRAYPSRVRAIDAEHPGEAFAEQARRYR